MNEAPPPPRSYGLSVSCVYGRLLFCILMSPRAVLLAVLKIGISIGPLVQSIESLELDDDASPIVPC